MQWLPIETAPKDGQHIIARDANLEQRWTFVDIDNWAYEEWLKNEAGEECLCFIPWSPIEWQAPNSEVKGGGQ